jgi:hypothetical protein
MQHYRAYIMGWDGQILSAVDLYCADDDSAKQRARQLVDGHDVDSGSEIERSQPLRVTNDRAPPNVHRPQKNPAGNRMDCRSDVA